MGKKMADQDPNKGTPEATFGSLVDEQIEERGLQTNRRVRSLTLYPNQPKRQLF